MLSKYWEINWHDKLVLLEVAIASWIIVMWDQLIFIVDNWLATWIWDYTTLDFRAFFVAAWTVITLAMKRALTDYKKQYKWKK
jgi:hypothetical protein